MAIDEYYWHGVMSGTGDCPFASALRPLLRGLSWPYGAVAAARRGMYAKGLLKSHAADVPVISIGNLTTGGTGKTPLVAWVTRYLTNQGRSPVILMRGYRSIEGVSDEAMLLEQMTGCAVIVNPDRAAGAATAVAEGADVLVMDDGFQHVRLRRDLDIVTIDATCPFGYGAVLPRGLLREPIAAAGGADVFVLTRCDLVDPDELAAIRGCLGKLAPAASVVESSMMPLQLCSYDGRVDRLDTLVGTKVWAFCGLGNPAGFYRMLGGLGCHVMGETTFNDHHAYDSTDIRYLERQARSADAMLLICTGKDIVKFMPPAAGVPIRWLQIDVDFTAGVGTLTERIDDVVSRGNAE